jgi:DNA repair exonuclease SbcCD ATPase subunit
MRIIAENIKGIKSFDIELPDKGVTCVSAISGTGKTTLGYTFLFVLYGEVGGDIGDGSSVMASLEHDGFKITRKTCNIKKDKGKRLTVESLEGDNVTLESDEAQTWIYDKYGYWNYSGYLCSLFPPNLLIKTALPYMKSDDERARAIIKMYSHRDTYAMKEQITECKKEFENSMKGIKFIIDRCIEMICKENEEFKVDRNKSNNISANTFTRAIDYLNSFHRPEEISEVKEEEIPKAISLRDAVKKKMDFLSTQISQEEKVLVEKCDNKRRYEIYLQELKIYNNATEKLQKEHYEIKEQLDSIKIEENIGEKIATLMNSLNALDRKVNIKKRLDSISARGSGEIIKMKSALEKRMSLEKNISDTVEKMRELEKEIGHLREETNKYRTVNDDFLHDVISARKNCSEIKRLARILTIILPITQEELNERIRALENAKIAKKVEHCPHCDVSLIYNMNSEGKQHLFIYDGIELDFTDEQERELVTLKSREVNKYVVMNQQLRRCITEHKLDEKRAEDEKYWEKFENKIRGIIEAKSKLEIKKGEYKNLEEMKKIIEEKLDRAIDESFGIEESIEQLSTELILSYEKEKILEENKEEELNSAEELINTIRRRISKFQEMKGRQQEKEKNIIRLRTELIKKEKEIKEVESRIPIEDGEDVNEDTIEKIRKSISKKKSLFDLEMSEYEASVIECDTKQNQLREWISYKEKRNMYNSHVKLLNELSMEWGKLNLLEESLVHLDELKRKLRNAEIESLGFSGRVNEYLREATERLYTNVKMDIQLQDPSNPGIDESKSDKIECVVSCNGIKRDTYFGISSGQASRFILCFCLALNQTFGPDLLVLDEPFSNLGEEDTIRMIAYLKEISERRGDMPIIILTPTNNKEVTEKFDRTIDLGTCNIVGKQQQELSNIPEVIVPIDEKLCQHFLPRKKQACGKPARFDNFTRCGRHKKES